MADHPCPPRARPYGPTTSDQRGFTLIELLVVVVMVGLLSAIALPSFLNQAARAKQTQAMKYIGMVNRAQQAFYLENARFATTLAELGFADGTASPDYRYSISPDSAGLAVTSTQAIPNNPSLKGYAGVVFTTVDPQGMASIGTVICQGTMATAPTPTPVETAGEIQIVNCNNP